MRRAGMIHEEIQRVRQAFKILFREGLPLSGALDKLENQFSDSPAVMEMTTFLRQSRRGINPMRDRFQQEAA
jgi:UDP-N-acetylglucosamine acyltransferase